MKNKILILLSLSAVFGSGAALAKFSPWLSQAEAEAGDYVYLYTACPIHGGGAGCYDVYAGGYFSYTGPHLALND